MRRLLPLLLLLAAACASNSGNRPKDVARPDIDVRQAAPIFFGSGTRAPISIDIEIRNNATVPLRVREIELRSSGMMQYSIDRTAKIFNETLAPGETRTLGMVSTATASRRELHTNEPLSIQAIIRFEANGRGFREIVLEQFAGLGT